MELKQVNSIFRVECSVNNVTGNNARLYWRGIETITGFKQQKRPVQTTDEAKLAEDLSTFCTSFDKRDFHTEQERVMVETQSRWLHPVEVSEEDVKAFFRIVNPRSATGPDSVNKRTLKECSESLAPVFTKSVPMYLGESYIPRIWKTSTIILVAKKRSAKEHLSLFHSSVLRRWCCLC